MPCDPSLPSRSLTDMSLPYRFDDARRAVVFSTPTMPSPWINYLSNGNLHAFVSQAGGGLAWWRSPLKSRISRYRLNQLPTDSPGFYIYIRQADGTVWSPSWRPVETPLDSFAAEHRPGITTFRATKGAISAELDLFIAPGEDALIWDLRLSNAGGSAVTLDVFAYVELCLLDWGQDTAWAYYVKHNLQVTHHAPSDALIYLYRHFHFNPTLERCPLVWFAGTDPLVSWTGDRDCFVGPYRYEKDPVAVERGRCGNEDNLCGEPCAVQHIRPTVPAGGSTRHGFFLGGSPQAVVGWPRALNDAEAAIARLRTPGAVERLKGALGAWWDEHLGTFQADLPDPDIARMVNVWNPVQSVHTGRYSRSISSQASGIRSGYGFRDTCQDMLAIAYRKPEWARDIFLQQLTQQYRDGRCVHGWSPEDKTHPGTHVHCDDHLWLPMVAHAIISETGEAGLLDTPVSWLAEDGMSGAGSASVWEHLLAGVRFSESHLGTHGLPLTLKGDWNDSIGKFSKKGRGESMMAAQQHVYTLRQLIALATLRGDGAAASEFQHALDRQSAAILACGWDGAWWVRGFDDDGNAIGSSRCRDGQIWLNSQTWMILAGLGDEARNRTALASVQSRLSTGVGLKKLDPSFRSFPLDLDPYSGYSPGCGENGAIFCHANTWAIIAAAKLGERDLAWRWYRELVPHLAIQHVGLERYQAEAYAYVSNIIGPENPKFGWANVTQVTGTAAWMDLTVTQHLLGIRPEPQGLRIDPCLPADWKEITVTRRFRGCDVCIRLLNPNGHGGGVHAMSVQGRSIAGNLITPELLRGANRLEIVCTLEG